MQTAKLATLEEYLSSNGTVSLERAIEMTVRVLSVLDYCHEKHMTHNHLEPDKIVVSDGDPVLIDFSFPLANGLNGSANGVNGSQKHEQFLELPEDQVSLEYGARNAVIGDVTAAAGLLLYAISGLSPGRLKDENGRMPHQRPEVRARVKSVGGSRAFMLNRIFDKAFKWGASERYQTARSLLDDLADLRAFKPSLLPAASLDDLMKELRSSTQSQTVTPSELRLQTAFNGLVVVFSELASALESDFRQLETGYRKETTGPVYSAFLKLNYKLLDEAELSFNIRIELVGSEIVVTALVNSGGKDMVEELFRTEHHSFFDSSAMEKALRSFLATHLTAVLAT